MNRRNFFCSSAATVILLPSLTLATIGCDTSWVPVAVADIPVIVNVLDTILNIVGPLTGNGILTTAIVAGVNEGGVAAKAGLVILQQLMVEYSKTKNASTLAKIDVTLTEIQANLTMILTAAHIKDAALQAVISTGVSLALGTLAAIQNLIPPAPTASARRMAGPQMLKTKIVLPTPEQLKSQFNAVAVLNGYASNQVK